MRWKRRGGRSVDGRDFGQVLSVGNDGARLVAALAWNDAIQTLFQQYLGSMGGALAAKIFYAVLVTVIIVTSVPNTNRFELRFSALLINGGVRELRFEWVEAG